MKEDDNWKKYVQIGLELAVTVLIFSLSGIFLDLKLGTRPYFTISGAFLGILIVFYLLWKKFK